MHQDDHNYHNSAEHEKIVTRLETMHTGIKEGLRSIHEDIKKVLVEVNGKYDNLKDELNQERLARTKMEGDLRLIKKTADENESLWKKVIYTGIGAVVLAVLAGLSKIGGAW